MPSELGIPTRVERVPFRGEKLDVRRILTRRRRQCAGMDDAVLTPENRGGGLGIPVRHTASAFVGTSVPFATRQRP